MKLIKAGLVLVLLFAATARVSVDTSAPAPPEQREYRKGEIVVEIEPGASIEAVNARHRTTTSQLITGRTFTGSRSPPVRKKTNGSSGSRRIKTS